MTFIIKFWISRISVLLENFFIKCRRHCWCRWIVIVNSIVSIWVDWLWMMMDVLILLSYHFRCSPFLRSIFIKIVIVLHSSTFIKDILRRSLVHHYFINIVFSYFIFICLLIFLFIFSLHFFRIWWATVFFILKLILEKIIFVISL
jgi:hypothetical protein